MEISPCKFILVQSATLPTKLKLVCFSIVSCKSWRAHHSRTPWYYKSIIKFEGKIIQIGGVFTVQLALKSNHLGIVCCKKAFQISRTAISDLKYFKHARLSQIQCFVLVDSLCLFSDVAVLRKSLIFPEVSKEFPRIQNSRHKSSNLVCWVTCLPVILKNFFLKFFFA